MILENYDKIKVLRESMYCIIWTCFLAFLVYGLYSDCSILSYVIVCVVFFCIALKPLNFFHRFGAKDIVFPDTVSIMPDKISVKFRDQTFYFSFDQCYYFYSDLSYGWVPLFPKKIIVIAFPPIHDCSNNLMDFFDQRLLDQYPRMIPIGLTPGSFDLISTLFQNYGVLQTRSLIWLPNVFVAVITAVGLFVGYIFSMYAGRLIYSESLIFLGIPYSCSLIFGVFFFFLSQICARENDLFQYGPYYRRIICCQLILLIEMPYVINFFSPNFSVFEYMLTALIYLVFFVLTCSCFVFLIRCFCYINMGRYIPPPYHKIILRHIGEIQDSWKGGVIDCYYPTFAVPVQRLADVPVQRMSAAPIMEENMSKPEEK